MKETLGGTLFTFQSAYLLVCYGQSHIAKRTKLNYSHLCDRNRIQTGTKKRKKVFKRLTLLT